MMKWLHSVKHGVNTDLLCSLTSVTILCNTRKKFLLCYLTIPQNAKLCDHTSITE